MTRAKTSEKLLEAEERVNQARHHVDRQVKLVAALKREGESAASALNTLEWLKHLLETRLASRDLLRRKLSEQTARGIGKNSATIRNGKRSAKAAR